MHCRRFEYAMMNVKRVIIAYWRIHGSKQRHWASAKPYLSSQVEVWQLFVKSMMY
jgi:hypothetical protein